LGVNVNTKRIFETAETQRRRNEEFEDGSVIQLRFSRLKEVVVGPDRGIDDARDVGVVGFDAKGQRGPWVGGSETGAALEHEVVAGARPGKPQLALVHRSKVMLGMVVCRVKR
jgi:hypothetical protein